MFATSPCDSVKIPSLEYTYYADDRRKETMSTCLMVGVAVIVVYLTLSRCSSPPMQQVPVMMHEASQMISARIAQAVTGDKVVRDASQVYEAVKSGTVSIIDCAEATVENINAWKTMNLEEKTKCETAARAWFKKHDEGVIMIFAPWCPHCHGKMPLFSTVATSTQVPFLMINAEALPRSAWQGENALYQCEYFPTFLAKKGDKVHPADGPEQAIALLAEEKATEPAEAPAEEAPAAALPEEEETPAAETMEETLAQLF